MQAEFINPFLNAAINVVQTIAQLKVATGKPYLKQDNKAFGAVTGVIGMSGTNVTGNMVISFEEKAILKVVSNMLFEEFTVVNDSVIDAVGEITNMICGGAKSQLAELGLNIGMASPVMLVGVGIELSQLSKTPIVVIPFDVEVGKFVVEANISVDKSKK